MNLLRIANSPSPSDVGYNISSPAAINVTIADLGSVVTTTTEAKGLFCRTDNMTQSQALITRLLSKDCGSTSIPMGIGSGVFVFVLIVILVGYLMKREDRKVQALSLINEKKEVTPISYDCASLIMAEPLKLEEVLVDDVFLETSAASSSLRSTPHSSRKKNAPSFNILCSEEIMT